MQIQNAGHTFLAEALIFVHGCEAATEAARQARLCEKAGDLKNAVTWRMVQGAVRRLPCDDLQQQAA